MDAERKYSQNELTKTFVKALRYGIAHMFRLELNGNGRARIERADLESLLDRIQNEELDIRMTSRKE